jgi:acetyl-CoA acyltransferase
MRDAVIVDAVRSPIGKRGGALSGLHAVDLSAQVLQTLAARNELDPALVDDVIWGCVTQVGEQSACIGRYAVLAAGWPEAVPGMTVNRLCGSSQQAVHQAAAGVIAGQYDVAIAGGVESMSRVPMGSGIADGQFGVPFGPMVFSRYNQTSFSQGIAAEMLAEEFHLTREDLDRHALDSHERAARAADAGRFTGQIIPIRTVDSDGASRMVHTDEDIRRGGTLQSLAALKPAFKEGGLVTAGNASQISDGSAALLITTSEIAERTGWTPMARIHSATVVGVDPITMLKGPMPATSRILNRSKLTLDDMGAYEINEAFACVSLAWQRQLGADYTKLNPNGGAIAIGHPLGGSGARLMTTLVHHMRDSSIRYGLQAMCEAGGMANATILELL